MPEERDSAAAPGDVCSESELLDQLRELSALIGTELCLNARQLAMRPTSFPDAWKGDLRSMRRLLQRLMAYAGLADADLDIEIFDARDGADELGSHLATDLYFDGVADGRMRFSVATIGDPRATIGPACIEVGRAVLHKRRLETSATTYRDAAEDDVELPSRHAGFLVASLLGWGVLVTNASFDPRSVGRNIGYSAENAWIESTVDVDPNLAAWVLALLWRARPDRTSWIDDLRTELNPSQRKILDRELSALEGEDEALRETLAWPAEQAGRGLPYDPLRTLQFDLHDHALDVS